MRILSLHLFSVAIAFGFVSQARAQYPFVSQWAYQYNRVFNKGRNFHLTNAGGGILQRDGGGNVIFTGSGSTAYFGTSGDPALMEVGTVTATNGYQIPAYKLIIGDTTFQYDCHGYTIADGQVWIQDIDMQVFLTTQALRSQNPVVRRVDFPAVGDWAVYAVGGMVVHSGIISSPGFITMAAGHHIFNGNSKTTTVKIDQGWTEEGTTITYWRMN